MKIIHIGAHLGNFGDAVSRAGMYNVVESVVGACSVEQFDIRHFYLNGDRAGELDAAVRQFGEKADLVIVGGGGFLSPRPDYATFRSRSLLEFSDKTLASVGNKLLLLSIGYEGSVSSVAPSDIRAQTEYLNMLSDCGVRIWLREDAGTGALEGLSHGIEVGLDCGCFVGGSEHLIDSFDAEFVVGICPSGGTGGVAQALLLGQKSPVTAELTELVRFCLEQSVRMKVFCHTNFDYVVAGQMIEGFPSLRERSLIELHPLSNPSTAVSDSLAAYQKCSIVVSSRFHGCVAAITQGADIFAPKSNMKAATFARRFGAELPDGAVVHDLKDRIIDRERTPSTHFQQAAHDDSERIRHLISKVVQ